MDGEPRQKKYKSVLLDLLVRIQNGEYLHCPLPSEAALCGEYGVGRNTIRRAIGELETKGILKRYQGRRTRLQGSSSAVASAPIRGKMVWLAEIPHSALDDNQYFFDLFRLLSQECLEHQIQLDFISMSDSRWPELFAQEDYLAAFTPSCVLGQYPVADLRRLQKIDNLIALEYSPGMPWRYSVSSDHKINALVAVRHLLANGRRRIGFFCSHHANTQVFQGFEERRIGYEQALQEAGLPCRKDFIRYIGYHQLNFILEVLRKEAGNLRQFDAVFAVTDLLAVLLLQLAREEKIRVPEELSIVGIDAWQPARYLIPQVTTVRPAVEDIAQRAFQLAMELNDHPSGKRRPVEKHILLPGRLLPGATVAPVQELFPQN